MNLNLEELKRLANSATKGKWEYGFPKINGESFREADCQVFVGGCLIANVSHGPIYPEEPFGSKARESNAAHIASANPAVILSLIAEIEALREKNKELVGQCARAHSRQDSALEAAEHAMYERDELRMKVAALSTKGEQE